VAGLERGPEWPGEVTTLMSGASTAFFSEQARGGKIVSDQPTARTKSLPSGELRSSLRTSHGSIRERAPEEEPSGSRSTEHPARDRRE
jgi:hypothetical protein